MLHFATVCFGFCSVVDQHPGIAFTLQVYAHVNEKMRQDSAARMQKFYEAVIQ